jgi:protein TonB
MFEDSTFESNGRIRTRSRGWMAATFILNGAILVALVLIPLVYPEALPRQALAFLLTTPPPPPAPVPPPLQQPNTPRFHGAPEFDGATLTAPRLIPKFPPKDFGPEQAPIGMLPGSGDESDVPGGMPDVFNTHRSVAVAHPDVKAPMRVPSSVVEGMLIHKVVPTYPPIGIAVHQQGTVVLAATISKAGTIENLRAVSGPAILQQAAIDAVKRWAYRPYLLNGQPVEVETTINVIFSLGS